MQDIVPATGLTIYKPSSLWPPPPEDVSQQVHELLRNRRGAGVVPLPDDGGNRVAETVIQPNDRETVVRVTGQDGVPVEIPHQIQLYTTNDLLTHPLVSPALAYLGGLPPLFVVASDREVLRDEIVFTSVIVMRVSDKAFILMGLLGHTVLRIRRSILCRTLSRSCTQHMRGSRAG